MSLDTSSSSAWPGLCGHDQSQLPSHAKASKSCSITNITIHKQQTLGVLGDCWLPLCAQACGPWDAQLLAPILSKWNPCQILTSQQLDCSVLLVPSQTMRPQLRFNTGTMASGRRDFQSSVCLLMLFPSVEWRREKSSWCRESWCWDCMTSRLWSHVFTSCNRSLSQAVFQRQHGSNSNTLSNALSLIQIQVVQTTSHNRLACTLCRSCTLFLNLRLPEVSPCSVERSPTSMRSVYHSIPPTVPDSKIRYSIRKYTYVFQLFNTILNLWNSHLHLYTQHV